MNHGCIKSRRRKSRESGGTICRGQEWGGFFSLPRPNLLAKLVHEGCWSVFVARGEELKRTTTLHFEFSLSLPPLYPPYRSSPLESPFLSTSFFRISPLLPSPPRPDCIADRFSVLFNLLSTTEVAEDLLFLFLFLFNPRDSFCFPFPLPLCLRSLKTSRRVLFRESLRRFIIFPPAEEKLSLRRRNALTFNVKNLATISQRRTIKFPRSLDLFRLLSIQFLRLQIPKQSLLRVSFPISMLVSNFYSVFSLSPLHSLSLSLLSKSLKIVSKRSIEGKFHVEKRVRRLTTICPKAEYFRAHRRASRKCFRSPPSPFSPLLARSKRGTVKIGQESRWSSPTKNRSIDRRDTAESTTRRVIRSVERIERKGNTSPGCSKEAAACSTPSRLPCNFIFAASPPDFGEALLPRSIQLNKICKEENFDSARRN